MTASRTPSFAAPPVDGAGADPPRGDGLHGLPSPVVPAPDASAALAKVVAELPRGGEVRSGQEAMVRAVAEAIEGGRHLVVRAGTGTGKTLGYLVPTILSGKRTVVATATRALQDQLAAKDLPFLEATLGHPFSWAVLKGRSNYVCVQRLAEVAPGSTPGAPAADPAAASEASAGDRGPDAGEDGADSGDEPVPATTLLGDRAPVAPPQLNPT